MANELFSTLAPLGFESEGAVCFGTWKGYAISLRAFSGKIYYATAAVRLQKIPAGLRKAINRALKEPGLKIEGAEILKKDSITISISFARAEDPAERFAERMDAFTGALRENGIAPADSCALTGAARPDSLCLAVMDGVLSYQPVCGAALKDRERQTQEKIEENRINGSYVSGLVGAVIGMLVGVALNVLGIVLTERIYALLFALVPLAAMFGYRLCFGKMSRGSIVIVILLSLLGVLLIPFAELSYYLVKEYGFALSEALGSAAAAMTDPAFLSEISGELLQLLLFMALGIWIAWRTMSSQTNSSQVRDIDTQLATLRPNPNHAAEGSVITDL